jgi:Protein of unknown function (DUF3500)
MRAPFLRLTAIGVGALLLTSAYTRMSSSSVMETAAKNFLAALTAEQKAKATYKFEADERFDWHFIPKVRKGLPLREMTPTQKRLAGALLAAGLSQQGYIKATSIMSLDDVLRQMEVGNATAPQRDPEGYFFTIFGEPSAASPWGYSVEGHHVSQNYTVVGGKVQDSPSFFGSNPAIIKEGPRKGMRVLAAEEDAARDLMAALDAEQQKAAIVDKTAYKDIITAASRKAALAGQASGLAGSKMNQKQFALLTSLIEVYADNMPEQLAQARMELVKKAGKNIQFAWAGVLERGGPHYYRVQSPAFLIEYDNTQNDANHIHSVWRDINGDFGLDLLKAHYQSSHK